MPELPEVETVKERLKKVVLNKKISSIDIYWDNIIAGIDAEEFKNKLVGQTINDITRRGKWLVFHLDDYVMLSHLRMEGKYFLKDQNEELEKHEHVVFNFDDGTNLRYHDTRKFGKMHLAKMSAWTSYPTLMKLGLEPWDEELTSEHLRKVFKSKSLPIKTVLLDQSIITGIGNIYADEILFASRISPFRKANKITLKEAKLIIENTKKVLAKAVSENGTTIRSYVSAKGVTGHFQNELMVHTKVGEPCPVCGTTIIKTTIGGRGTYYCPKCQAK